LSGFQDFLDAFCHANLQRDAISRRLDILIYK